VLLQSDPYLMKKHDGTYYGYCVDLLDLLTKALKIPFNYELRLVRDGKYGAREPNGNWNGMIGELIEEVYILL